MEWTLFSFERCRLTMKSLVLHMIDCWIHHNEAPYTRVPWVLGLIKLQKLPLFASWWSIGHWMEDHTQAPPLWIFRMIWWNQKNQIAKFGYLGHPNNQVFGYSVIWFTQKIKYLVIRLFGSPKKLNIWLFGYSGDPNNQIWWFGSSKENRRNQIWQ